MMIPVQIQQRHVHLSREDQDALFGSGAALTEIGTLSHRGQVVYKETVTIVGKDVSIEHVRILGPTRRETQIELSPTDAMALGIDAPVRVSGDASHAGWGVIRGPKGEKRIRSVLIPVRHIHCNEQDAETLGVSHHDLVTVSPEKRPDLKIEHVAVRVHPTFSLEFHLTNDEAAEFWLQSGDRVTIVS